MTADLDLSPEAVERLAKRHALHVSSKYPTAATLRALAAENTRLRAERDAAWQAGTKAMREAAAICKRIRDKKCENDDQAIGALECTLAIQDALAAMDTPKGGGDE